MIMASEEQKPKPVGIACPSCGCCDLRIKPGGYVRQLEDGTTKRIKVCRHCGRKVMTTEKVNGK